MSYITPEDFPLLKPDQYSDKECPCGSGWLMSLHKRGLNTCYAEEESNYLGPCCDMCFASAWNYYEELWQEYYSGLGIY